MKKIITLLIICLPFYVYSQKWQQYSDSVLVYFKKNDIDKASQFIKLADIDLEQSFPKKDTLFADYIYRKGVVKSYLGDFDSKLLKQSLDIWEASSKKNYLKIMKINYFIGTNYFLLGNQSQNKIDYDSSYVFYEKCYSLVKKYNYQKQTDFKGILYSLSFINYYSKKDLKTAKKYANEYIDIIKVEGITDYNFDFVFALRFKEDFITQESLLQEYLAKYNYEKLNDPVLLFKIYFHLCLNKQEFKDGIYPKYPNGVIKYGEKAIEIYTENNLKMDMEMNTIYLLLEFAYGQIKDNINKEKYKKLINENSKESIETDYYDELENLYENENYIEFKIKFDEYEDKFKTKNQFTDLLEIYKYSLTLFERSILFSRGDIEKQIELISKNRSSLTTEDKLSFDIILMEYSIVTGQYNKGLEISTNNLNTKDIVRKLHFYSAKAACEDALGFKEKSKKTAIKTFELASSFYGDNDPRLLPYLNALLNMDVMGTDPYNLKIETRALKILYENKLEQTVSAIGIWNSLGEGAMNRNNNRDALLYFEKSILIFENTKTINNPNLYIISLYNLINIYIQQNNFDKAKEYLEKSKKYLDENPNIMPLMNEGYYYSLGNFYFQQDKFLEAKVNYEKSFTFYDSKKNSLKKIRYFFCSYFLENNADELIENIKTYQKENNDTFWGLGILYLLKYNSGDFVGGKNILENQLNKLIKDNNKYFHLLSNDEKEILYKAFTNQFELLNTYLLKTDSKFLDMYIHFRFYSKSLLFSNSFISNGENEINKELYSELRNNTRQINKAIETKSEELKSIEELKNKNREIEKFLSANTKPLTVPTLKDLKNKLNLDEAYVEIIRINKQSKNSTKKAADIINIFTDSISYGAIIIKKNVPPKFILIDGNNRLENQFVSDYQNKIQNKQEDKESYHLLFEKIEAELKNINKIYLVTDGVYNSINIESIYNPNKKQYLIDYLKIQQIQNVRSITDEKKDFKVSSTSKAVLFGNPDYDLTIAKSATNDISIERNLESSLLDKIKTVVKISPLVGTQKEIESLNTILKDSKCSVELYSTITATEDHLKNVQSPDILHIATHGYFLKEEETSKTKQSISALINDNYRDDSYLKSGLLFAGAQNTLNGKLSENSDNGILTAEEAKSLNLKDTELVVLSACETGLGDYLVGQGVVGLQRAFMIAGAKSVIMSLWSVSDEKTQQLMTLFYTNWIKNNMSKEEALHQAKIEMKKLYPQPYYWAGFVLLE